MGFFSSDRAEQGVADLNGKDFEVFLAANELAYIEFYMPGCSHCKRMDPLFQSLAGDLGGKAGFAKVNAPANLEVAYRYDISATPTYIVFAKGEAVDRLVGEAGIDVLRSKLASHL